LRGIQHSDFRIILVGAGNLAWHLGHIFFEKGIKVECVVSRTIDSARLLASEINSSYSDSLQEIPPGADFIIVAINDSNIVEVLQAIKPSGAIVVHTSGSVDIGVFEGKFTQYGVLYPFQTFTKGIPLKITAYPVCIEGSDDITLAMIGSLAGLLSSTIRKLNSEQRRILHLCGVLTNNFTNHLITRAIDLMGEQKLEGELLMPLLYETVYKLEITTASAAQTGPARRNNMNIIEKHLEMLKNDPELKKLYSSLTDSIIAYYSK
jgi:predicted short-subunit dehydrogenase-like oxidoreductase (DUF2520 family)